MSSRPITLRRLGVAAVAVATVAAGMPLLVSGVANAVPPNGLTVTQQDGRTTAAAGTCTAFVVTPRNVLGTDTIDPATITVRIAENPASDTQDVDFCTVEGGTGFAEPPGYTNGLQVGGDPGQEGGETLQTYAPGPSITPATNGGTGPSGNPGNPDVASGAEPATFTNTTSVNNRNPSGVDTVIYRATGPIVVGVVALTPGSVTVEAFVDENRANGDRPRRRDASEIGSAPRALTVTAGGRQGSAEAADAVKRVELVDVPDGDEESVATQGNGGSVAVHDLQVSLFNANGDRVSGVRPVLRAVSGPNAPSAFAPNGTFTASCDQVVGQGFAAPCTYSASQTGRDLLVAFVNQSGGTSGQDSAEPADTVSALTLPPTNTNPAAARFLDLTPESASVPAGERRPFTATVTDAAGAPVQGVQVRFDESGSGAFVNPATQSATSTVNITTNNLGQAEVQFASNSTETGTNTITATIATTNTQCTAQASGSTPAGRCSDTSSVTLTRATASPSPSATGTASPRPSTSASASPSSTTSPNPTTAGSRYRGLPSPVRVLDTRDNRGPRRSGEIVVDLSQRLNDAEATAAVLNVTVTNPTARGFLVAYPNGNTKPGTSNVNFETNQTQANEVVVGLSGNKRVSLFVDSASAHVIVDLVGSFTRDTDSDTGRVVTNAPVRAFDSRTTNIPRRAGEVVLDLSTRLPDNATDAILNVTVQGPNARGYVVVYPSGTARPPTSNVNFERGQTQANEVVTRVGTGGNAGRVSFFIDSASSALIVDVVGAVVSGNPTNAQTYTALAQPTRALDTRDNRGARRNGEVTVAMPSSVPSNATGVILNVTATNGTRSGFVAVYPAGAQNPGTSNVNFPTNLTQANEVTTGLGTNRSVTLFVGGRDAPAAHLIVDVVGYLTR